MKRLLTPLCIVIVFIVLVIAGAGALMVIHTPVETPVTFTGQGITLTEDGERTDCEIVLSGTMETYRLNIDTPRFSTDAYSSRQGLFFNERRLFPNIVLGWDKEGEDCVTYIKNGTRFFTNREMSYVVIIHPNKKDARMISVAPAANLDEAEAIIESIVSDQNIQFLCAEECQYLLDMVG